MCANDNTGDTDLLVIGGGPGGYSAAFRAARLGIQTTLVEANDSLGGVCLHQGCIPSKTLLHVAEMIEHAAGAEQFGLKFAKPDVDLDKLREWKEHVIGELATGLDKTAKQLGVRRVRGRAGFENGSSVTVAGDEPMRIAFKRAIVATGSRSIRLRGIEIDSPRVMHSRGALALADVPEHLLVIGGGYIGLELGSVYAALGSKVTVVEMLAGLLPGADADLVRPLARRLKDVLAEVCLKTKVTAMKEVPDGVEVTFDGQNVPQRTTFDKVLVSVGRYPSTRNLGLENTKVQTNQPGFIQVDEQFRTAEPTIYAIGDVIGNPMLAHKAVHEGQVCAEILAGHDRTFDARAIPAVVFTDPEIAWCGLTATEAKEAGTKVAMKKMPWGASGRAVAMGRTDGLTKILFDPDSQRVLGVGLCGPHAGEMIAEGVLAIQMGATAADLASSIHPHPTLSEVMGEVADLMVMSSATKR